MNQLKISHLTVTYNNGFHAVNDLSLDIGNGMFGLLGPNGAGKSSLMKTLAGLQKCSSGRMTLNGIDISENPDYIRQNLGFLPQDFGVYPKVSAQDLLNHIALLKGISNRSERSAQVESLLEKVNLTHFRNKEVRTFSGGMRQRFGIAQALLGNPRIVIVDEPTAGLDPGERNRFNTLLDEISKDVIIILSTHLVEDVRNLCSEMAVMNYGKILNAGKPDELIDALKDKIWMKSFGPNEPETAGYQIISRQMINRQMYLTVFSETEPEGFHTVPPQLEHVYFKTLTQNF
ncbi:MULTISPECIES: ABC transporter ATP-binding protein [Chryseobacterium]|uniref:ABC-type multidrug transport system ATPase subunit n=1 Tax=Chryseobacterium camelliae TaxID=1265445 RepID=A0ABU0TIM8_9FLAO|nr:MULTISPECIES: ABC transporter ATP-binding protein [Chryseobacterium]MDT3409290.1 ABC-type multidrug transport system ATPase subunit [Pseudacidovorax intermedius]MDQ1096846.1 ABC-type multidrug transport system ATPase subunit [Chryseobacterium camelliae]MDQ1100788.1 ABC-type multidrug transport system ATPase subunit [Chryseobacterium sp. SORGH_AS_1048]MDR6084231.1 ABC-type multidrug transport system ATPase subunit [Chryseobacterium sp. SORGH_AS_0909]MDR6132503.1 ABC-type multidrug transport 